ncbi:DNA-binding GntR family transcriptional regulator [Lipingzhangella halophila]|uniref:DNA-binding GntR family transcriptional regulator n=1 Tax=Lipingzhangella halophila TaxID=1783352 RepID=A0A7W7W5P9_9ACTN|nr:GntR family transcriptional regulator [Lipingzhangella halophila]MBB4934035.1 DNA-binding GntR family transcriptional regulator [Lipingzhangella halophila]
MTEAPLSITLDRNSPVPLYFQVAQELERRIQGGAMPAGTRLENEVVLAGRLGLSRPTMRRAIEYLVDRGLLVRKRGVGTQVVQPRVRRPVELSSLYDDLVQAGQRPRTEVLRLAVERPPHTVAAALEVSPDTEVYVLERLRYAGDDPLALLHNYLPLDLVRLSEDALTGDGLYNLMRAAGITMKIASQSISARGATAAEARMLGENRGAPLLTMDRTAYDDVGRVVEIGSHVYRASRYAFELTLTG